MYRLRIISVGKIKKPFWLEAIGHYRKMLGTALCVEALSNEEIGRASCRERV